MDKVKVVAVYIQDKDNVLMVQEKGSAFGLWTVPVGHVDSGESLREAAKREVKEETGYSVSITKSLGRKIISHAEYRSGKEDEGKIIEVNFFEGKIKGGKLSPDRKDLLNARWIKKNKVLDLPLRGDWLKDILI